MSPPRHDPFMYEIEDYDENGYEDIMLGNYPTNKKKDSFMEEVPFGLFRNFSIRSDEGETNKIG